MMPIAPITGDFLKQFESYFGQELGQRLVWQEKSFACPSTPSPCFTDPSKLSDYNPSAAHKRQIWLLGGGLSLLHAALLARQGFTVGILEQGSMAVGHREWNASWQELQVLVETGLCSDAQLRQLVLARYDYGICRWHGGGSYQVHDVLDCAVDGQALLSHAKALAAQAGVMMLAHMRVEATAIAAQEVTIVARDQHGQAHSFCGELVLDGRGAASPYGQAADLMCPTVGGVVQGLEIGNEPWQINPKVGEILVTTNDTQEGIQYIWEAFPQDAHNTTVYLFYYGLRHNLSGDLLQHLYRRFFRDLPQFKRGKAFLRKPTFGLIPGWSRLQAPPRSPSPRLLLLGDAAARHSPLTFCGFGAMLRSLKPTSQQAHVLLQHHQIPRSIAPPDDALHGMTGGLAMLIAKPSPSDTASLNRLLNVAFATLYGMGNHAYAGLLKDRLSAKLCLQFLRRVAKQYPAVYGLLWRTLGTTNTLRWMRYLGKLWWQSMCGK